MTSYFRDFLFIFFRPPTLNLKKNPVNQLIKKSGLMVGGFIEKHGLKMWPQFLID